MWRIRGWPQSFIPLGLGSIIWVATNPPRPPRHNCSKKTNSYSQTQRSRKSQMGEKRDERCYCLLSVLSTRHTSRASLISQVFPSLKSNATFAFRYSLKSHHETISLMQGTPFTIRSAIGVHSVIFLSPLFLLFIILLYVHASAFTSILWPYYVYSLNPSFALHPSFLMPYVYSFALRLSISICLTLSALSLCPT